MTILFITHYSGFYGANKSLMTLMSLLRDRHGVSPIVLLPSKGQMCDELEKSEIPYRIMHYYWWVNYNQGLFQSILNKRKQLKNLFTVGKICDLFKNLPIDLVYSNSSTINIGVFISERLGVPHIWQFRESLSQYKLSLSLFLSKIIWKRKCNKRYIMISDYMMEYNSRFLPKDRMTRVYNGVSIDGNQIAESHNTSSLINLCIVGVICHQKNQMDAIYALSILRQQGYPVLLHLVGTSQENYLNKIKEAISELNLDEFVIFHGHQNNVFSILSSMDIGLMTSIDEAFGRSTIEYMLSEMPVVASDSGANKELITDGETGYIYKLGDSDDLAGKIKKLLDAPEEARSFGIKAKAIAEKNFTAENNADQIYNVIKDVFIN